MTRKNSSSSLTTRDGRHFKPNQCTEVNSFVVRGMELQKLKGILSSTLVRGKETVLTQGCDLLLNAFRLLGVSRRRRIAYITTITITITASNSRFFPEYSLENYLTKTRNKYKPTFLYKVAIFHVPFPRLTGHLSVCVQQYRIMERAETAMLVCELPGNS